jgi:hypothetical protein
MADNVSDIDYVNDEFDNDDVNVTSSLKTGDNTLLMSKEHAYPDPTDNDFLNKIFAKREYNYHKMKERKLLTNYEDIEKHRKDTCDKKFSLNDHQVLISNFICPDTPFKGAILFHGLGSGKTCAGISIAEKFIPMVQRYGTKIYVLVSGPLIKEMWKHHLVLCTGEKYKKFDDKSLYKTKQEKEKIEKNAINIAMQNYKFMSYRSFYKRVLGEKIIDKSISEDTNKKKVSYKKTEEGEFERDIGFDRIYNLNNTLIIVDEAHQLTNNAYGDALKHIIQNSHNLKIVLLTGTPMKNSADDIIELVNFLRPLNSQIEKDKIFTTDKVYLMDFKPGGLEYLKNMTTGYISHIRGADPLTYAKRVDKGDKPDGLLFTKMTRCKMLQLQRSVYDATVVEFDDSLDRKSEAVANFVFPGLSTDKKTIIGYYGKDGLATVKNQLKMVPELFNKKLSLELFGHEKDKDLIKISDNKKTISGKILLIDYLKYFSTKFYQALKNINKLVNYKKGAKTAFIYSNLVKVGIELFQEILIQNGYLEYQEDARNYNIQNETVCYYCGKSYAEHNDNKSQSHTKSKIENLNIDENNDIDEKYETVSDSKSDHVFYPGVFITITGKSNEESVDAIHEEKKTILDTIFNHYDNRQGKNIKFVLGSKVMNEGISLKNVGEVHILDVYFNLGKVDQAVGRAIRYCSHYKLMNENNVYPTVNVYKYVVTLEKGLSTEEELYQKAEQKYLLIKKVERALKEVAIDCPLNMPGNMFKEEIIKYKNCEEPNENNYDNQCPAVCDYTNCHYKCRDNKLNAEYYDPERYIYKHIDKHKIDYSTFSPNLARNEIEFAKANIKDMYILGNVYIRENIVKYVKNAYPNDKKELFDEFFVNKALDELLPVTENDFNNFNDVIIGQYNRPGYLIYVHKYYIFQPFDQNESDPMYYRTQYTNHVTKKMSLYNYLKTSPSFTKFMDKSKKTNDADEVFDDEPYYNFADAMDYYDVRQEYDFVGFIDKEIDQNKNIDEIADVFKLRERRAKILEKKRATGIPSLKGAVCAIAKNKDYLNNVVKKLNINSDKSDTRATICKKIENKMLHLEKYGTNKNKNKYTYIMIPTDHPDYKFPYNLEDRVNFTIDKIENSIKIKLSIKVNIHKHTSGVDKDLPYYEIIIDNNPKLDKELIATLGGILIKDKWTILIQ